MDGHDPKCATFRALPAYVETHFRYTLLEHYDSTVPKNVVLAREAYWKQALDTRKHGYNDN